MGSVALIGGCLVVGLAMMQDSNGTVYLISAVIGIRGVTFICKKMAETLNNGYAQLIDFAGWTLSAASVVGILLNAKASTNKLVGLFNSIGATYVKVDMFFENIGTWLDKINILN